MPLVMRVGKGRTPKKSQVDELQRMREGYSVFMYQLDIGQVYVDPEPKRKE